MSEPHPSARKAVLVVYPNAWLGGFPGNWHIYADRGQQRRLGRGKRQFDAWAAAWETVKKEHASATPLP